MKIISSSRNWRNSWTSN